MNEINISTFGEQTLDALFEEENINAEKASSQKLKGRVNSQFQKSSLPPLKEIINGNSMSDNSRQKPSLENGNKSRVKKLADKDRSNIDKYFQDSTILSNLYGQINTSNIIDNSKKKTRGSSAKDGGSNSKVSDSKTTKGTLKSRTKSTENTRLSEEIFPVESSGDEILYKASVTVKQDDSVTRKTKTLRNTVNSIVKFTAHNANDFENKRNNTRDESSSTCYALQKNDSPHNSKQSKQNIELSNRSDVRAPRDIQTHVEDSNTNSVVNLEQSNNSIVCIQDRCKLSAWGLPLDILKKYESRGMTTMFPWQVECLSNYKVLEESKNLVYSAPTSAGKTLVAEMLVMKTVLERQKKVLFILPFVSVVREKMFYFQDLLSSSGIRVEGFMGGIAPTGGFAAAHIAIATIEKANSLINRLMEEGDLSSLGAVVVDELHLLGDPHRGYLLELLLTKLKYMTLREEHLKIQLIGMSATLPNLPLLAEWLDAELFNTEFRPVPLNEQYKINRTIYDSKFKPIRQLDPSPELPNDSDNILQLCIETIADGHSALIFCPTKNWCEQLARQIAAIFFKLGCAETAFGHILRNQLDSNAIEETLSQLKRSPAGLDEILKSTVSFGVAFHHAGLTMDERDIIEGSFRTGALRILTATSTLSSGVNLPARRVIVRSLVFHGKIIDTLTYRQMIGRAGRMGKDTAGESILICKPNEKNAAESLISAPLDPVGSCLESSGPLIRALLEAVASEIACTPSDVDLYSRCTLASFSPDNKVKSHTEEAMKFLALNEFIKEQESKEKEQRWVASALGKACLASSVSPGDGLFLFEELQRARKSFVLETELHLIYLVTPFNSGSLGQIDWMIFFNLWKSLSDSDQRVGKMVGIEERFIMTAIRGVIKFGKQQNIHKRFFTALALHDLVREIPLTTVSEKYGCSRGVLQSLQQSASTFAGMVTQFCKQLGWDCMELLFCQFQARLQFGVCRELLDLLRLPMLNGLRARSLYKEGIKCVADLASADELNVERALYKAVPFESEKEQDGEHVLDAAKRNKVRSIFVTGRDGLTPYQAAVMLVQEARTLVQHELGVKEVHWKRGNERSFSTLSTMASQNSEQNLSNKQSIINMQLHEESTSASLRNITCSETANTEHKIPQEKKSLVNAIRHSEHHISTKMDLKSVLTRPLDIEKVFATNTNKISPPDEAAGTEKSSNKAAKKKPKFNLLGAKRKTRQIIESHPDNDSIQSVNQSVISSSTKTFNPGKLTSVKSSRETRNDIDAENKALNRSNDNKVVDNLTTKVPSPTTTIAEDLKLTMSPVVTLEWLSFDENMLSQNNLGNNSKLLKPKAVSEQSETQFLFKDELNVSYSRSPSLFEDSLYLDSQFCNQLEQNVNSSLTTEQDNKTATRLTKSIVELGHQTKSPGISAEQSIKNSGHKNTTTVLSHEPNCTDLNNQILHSEEIDFSWNSTMWNESRKSGLRKNSVHPQKDSHDECIEHDMILGQKVTGLRNNNNDLSENKTAAGKVKTRGSLISSDFNMSDNILGTPMHQHSHFKSISSKSSMQNVRNIKLMEESDSRKRKFNEIHSLSDSSPVINVLNLSSNRRLSFGSNKSDSDDVILGSQNLEPVKGKGLTRSKFEQSKRVSVDRKQSSLTLDESRRQSNIVKNKSIELLRTGEGSVRKVLYQENYSPDSIVSNSEEDSPVRRLRVTQSLHKKTLNSSFIVQKIDNLRKCKKRCVRPNNDKEISSPDQNLDWNILDIVNVTWNEKIFKLFSSELKQKSEIAIALAQDKFVNDVASIGSRLIGPTSATKKKYKKNESCIYLDTIINGVAISWGRNVVYYVSFENRKEGGISLKERLQLVQDVLTDPLFNVRCYGSKEVYKKLYQCCSITSNCRFLDPNVAEWLLHPDLNEKNLYDMANTYFPQGAMILQHANSVRASAGTSSENEQFLFGRHRAAAQATVTWHIMTKLIRKLHAQSDVLLNTFKDVETKVTSSLARMELTGIGINLKSLQELSDILQGELSTLEKQAYSLAGKKFSFTSSKEVAQVLGMYKGVKVSTNKAVLENSDNPISNLVISWRKLSTTQMKMVIPLLNLAQQGSRVRGCCLTRTATGRISMHEPNLQNVPRDFHSEDSSFVISMRMAFVPTCGNIMLSADYCQLELRILAHFAEDPILCKIMKKDSDIFKNIAAQWNHISVDEVNDDIRQRTKQLCYGIIYGIGSKALAKQLSVTELEAIDFMQAFMRTYPNVRNWLNQVITQSREDGYVTTLTERRRLLPGLNSELKSERSHAERQAVNTKIQGSAADLAKKAMVLIDERLQEEYPEAYRVLPEIKTRKLRSSKDWQNRGAYLVLQLHDELLYEVNAADLDRVALLVKRSMEEAYRLTIPLPVKIKVGPTWGSLTEYNV